MINPVSFEADVATTKPKQKDPSVNVNSVGGTIGAAVAGGAVHRLLPEFCTPVIINGMKKEGTFAGENGKIVHDAVKQMLKDTQLDKKGVRIKFLDSLNTSKHSKIFNQETPVKNYFDLLFVNTVRDGNNAFFLPKDLKLPKATLSEIQNLFKEGKTTEAFKKLTKDKKVYIKANSVILSKNQFHSAGFHELGHAMNWNFSKVGKFLQKCRPVSLYAPMILGLYGAFSKKSKPKTENGELTTAQKTNNFLRDNAGKLTFMTALPMLIEEGMATIKGQKFANKLLKPELAKKVLKGNCIAYTSYLLMAVAGALATTCAVKIKDNAVEKKENKIKLQQKLQAELDQVA